MRASPVKWGFHLSLLFVYLLLGILWQPIPDIISGLFRVLQDPSFLTRDYVAVGGIGAAFWNAALVLSLELLIVRFSGAELSGKLIASILITIGGSLFGINVISVLPIFFGAWLYSRMKNCAYREILFPMFMSAGLAPLVSIIMFEQGLPPLAGILLAYVIGTFIGLVIPILIRQLACFHQGFTLYNAGFVAGVVAMLLVSLMHPHGVQFNSSSIHSETMSVPLVTLLLITCFMLLAAGIFLNKCNLRGYGRLLRSKGKMVEYEEEFGTGLMLFNMGLMGLLATPILLLFGGRLNGAMVGATLGMIGFSAIGQNPLNSWPIVSGVIAATLLSGGSMHSAMVTAMFGTCLAPITGEFGVFGGFLAGFLHFFMVSHVIVVHAGTNLFNNGFASGFVAAVLVPVLYFVRERVGKEKKDGR